MSAQAARGLHGLFDEPNLFWAVIGIMVAMAVATVAIARWRRWL